MATLAYRATAVLRPGGKSPGATSLPLSNRNRAAPPHEQRACTSFRLPSTDGPPNLEATALCMGSSNLRSTRSKPKSTGPSPEIPQNPRVVQARRYEVCASFKAFASWSRRVSASCPPCAGPWHLGSLCNLSKVAEDLKSKRLYVSI